MNSIIKPLLDLTHDQLSKFASLEDFWQQFDTIFGTQYDRTVAVDLRSQWQTGDFSQLPEVEVMIRDSLDNRNGTYAARANKIYLSASFVARTTPEAISAVLLREMGSFVNTQINQTRSGGDQGAVFAKYVQNERANAKGLGTSNILFQQGRTATYHNSSSSLMRCSCSACISAPTKQKVTLSSSRTTPQQLTSVPSGDNRIDSLLSGYRWISGTISYSFYSGGSYYGSEVGLAPVSDVIKFNVRKILVNVISPLINVNFVEVSDSASSYGQIRYLLSTNPGYAYAYYPFSTDTNQGNSNDRAGDVFLNPSYDNSSSTNGFQGGVGTHGYMSLIHETLHALGLKHPGNYNAGGGGTDGPYLPFGQDNTSNTVMTYNFTGNSAATPMAYDLLALQYLYGARTFNSSNTTYRFRSVFGYSTQVEYPVTVGSETNPTKLTIWDSGGIDTLDFSGLGFQYSGYRFELYPGGWLTTQSAFNGTTYQADGDTGGTTYVTTTYGTQIGYGVYIENIVNSSSDDYIIAGLGTNNVFSGYGFATATGNDTIEGANNLDTLNLSAFPFSSVTQTQSGNNLVLGLGSGRSVTVKDYYLQTPVSRIKLQFSSANALSFAKTTDGSETGLAASIFTLTRAGDLIAAQSVNYSLGGTATVGSDYTNPGAGIVTFAAGSATATINLPTIDDAVVDSAETIIATITAPTGYTISGSNTATATIADNDTVATSVTLAVAPGSVLEDGTTNLVYTFTRSGVTTTALTVKYNVGGTATLNTDYTQTGATSFTSTTGSITFAAGASTAIITVDPTADTIIESNETVVLRLATGTGYTIGTTTAITGSITNDDFPAITLAVSPTSVLEDGTTNLVYTFTRSGVTTTALTVNYIVGGTATLNTDYTQTGSASFSATTGTITFAAGSSTATLTIDPTADTIFESDETVRLTLASNSAYTIGTTNAVLATITNDELLTYTSFSNPASISIPDAAAGIPYPSTINISGVSANLANLKVTLTNLSHTFPDDIDILLVGPTGAKAIFMSDVGGSNDLNNVTLTIDPSATVALSDSEQLTSGTYLPTDFESGDTFNSPAPLGPYDTNFSVFNNTNPNGVWSLYIMDDEVNDGGTIAGGWSLAIGTALTVPNISLAVSPTSVLEDGTTNLVYTFTRSGVTTTALTVNYIVGGTATFNTDYTQTGATSFTSTTGSITFAAGASTAIITVDPTADTIIESNETVVLRLATGTGYTIGTTTAITGSITNDDLPAITLAVAPGSVLEDGTTNLVYTFTRAGSTTTALTVKYNVGGTATFNTDYTQTSAATFTATTGTITFAAGSSTATLTVDPTADTIIESDETVALTLATGTGYSIGTTTAVNGTITNDDFGTLSTLSIVKTTDGAETGAVGSVFTLTRTGNLTAALNVNYSLGGTATVGSDYTNPGAGIVTFAAGSATATINLPTIDDAFVDSAETIIATITAPTGYTISGSNTATATIADNDTVATSVTLAVAPVSVLEDGTTNLVYTFTRSGVTTTALTVNYIVGGTATFNTDYTQTGATSFTSTTGSITFAAGASTANLTVDPTADTIIESDETVALTLATGTGYTVATTTAVTGTIINDDPSSQAILSINDITVVEGKDANAFLTVSLSSLSNQPVSVNYTLTPVNATPGVDYTNLTGTLIIAANTSFGTISIPILNDNFNEPDEAFTVTLSGAVNATISPDGGTGEVIITDTWQSSITRTLPSGVENLKLIGTAAINGTGNVGNNVLTGNSANNTLSGLNGDDTYSFLANTPLGIDTIIETPIGGIDTIDFSGTTAAVKVNLGVITSQTVNSNLKLILSANNVIENATGGTGNDRFTGNSLDNTLIGGDGNDQLLGLAGNDTLWGGAGDDNLTGGVGSDKYLFQSGGVFSSALGVDFITQFEAGLDQIVLSKTTFNAITNSVGQPLTDFAVVADDEFVDASNAHIVFSQSTGTIFYNRDGNVLGGVGVFEFASLGNPDVTLSGSNFSLVV